MLQECHSLETKYNFTIDKLIKEIIKNIDYYKTLNTQFIMYLILFFSDIVKSLNKMKQNIGYGKDKPELTIMTKHSAKLIAFMQIFMGKKNVIKNISDNDDFEKEIYNLPDIDKKSFISIYYSLFNLIRNEPKSSFPSFCTNILTKSKNYKLTEIINLVDDIFDYLISLILNVETYDSIYLNLEEFQLIKRLWNTRWKNPITKKYLFLYIIYNSEGNNFIIHVYNKIMNTLTQYRKNPIFNQKKIDELQRFNIVGLQGYKYTLLQLFNSVFSSSFPSIDNWTQSDNLRKIAKISIDNNLQALEIVINEGTSREPIQSFIFETFQNAIDIIRQTQENVDNIIINISPGTSIQNEVSYQISDPIGLNSKALLSLSIPFLSTKTKSQLTTGEIGSGFFNVYRIAKRVIIESRNDFIIDKPIFKNNRIVDINRYHIPNINAFNGTRITIELLYQTNDEKKMREEKLYQITEITNNCLGILPLTGFKINVNHEIHLIERKEIYNDGYFIGYKVPDLYDSYVLTKDIPFDRLEKLFSPFVSEEIGMILSNGLVVNFLNDAYSPVQSRTTLSMNSKQKQVFEKFLSNFIYLALLTKQIETRNHNYINNFNSEESSSQVYSNSKLYDSYKDKIDLKSDTNLFLSTYVLDGERYNFSQIIDILIKMEISNIDLIHYEAKKLVNNEILYKAVLFYLLPKEKSRLIDETLKKKEKTKEIKFYDNQFPTLFISCYWKLLNLKQEVPKVYVTDLNPGVLGSYNRETHSIKLNPEIKTLSKPYTEEKLLLFIRGEGITFYGNTMPASTVIHELLHAIKSSEHSGGHDAIEIDGTLLSFDDAANYYYRKVLEKGLLKLIIDSDHNFATNNIPPINVSITNHPINATPINTMPTNISHPINTVTPINTTSINTIPININPPINTIPPINDTPINIRSINITQSINTVPTNNTTPINIMSTDITPSINTVSPNNAPTLNIILPNINPPINTMSPNKQKIIHSPIINIPNKQNIIPSPIINLPNKQNIIPIVSTNPVNSNIPIFNQINKLNITPIINPINKSNIIPTNTNILIETITYPTYVSGGKKAGLDFRPDYAKVMEKLGLNPYNANSISYKNGNILYNTLNNYMKSQKSYVFSQSNGMDIWTPK